MSGFSAEAKVGAFVVVGLLIFGYFSIRVGVLGTPIGGEGTELIAPFDDISGLEKRAAVRVAGVRVGSVEDIELRRGKAYVRLRLNPGVTIPKGARAEIGSMGLMGEKYVHIVAPETAAEPYQNGDEIATKPPTSIDQIVTVLSDIGQDIKDITASFRSSLGSEEGKVKVENIVTNVERITAEIRGALEDNRGDIKTVVANLAQLSENLKELVVENRSMIRQTVANVRDLTGEFKSRGPEMLAKLSSILERLDGLLATNEGNIGGTLENIQQATVDLKETMSSVASIANKIDSGEGSIGKLLNETTTTDNINETLEQAQVLLGGINTFETSLGYRAEYQSEHDNFKSYLSLRLQPREDKYYLVEFVDDPRGSLTSQDEIITVENPDGSVEVRKIHSQVRRDKFKFSAQIARVFPYITLRGGILESEGGFGADVRLFDDRLRFSAEAFRFGDQDLSPNVRLFGTWDVYPNLFVTAGVSEALEDEERTLFFGGGLTFVDDDLKRLLGLASAAGS